MSSGDLLTPAGGQPAAPRRANRLLKDYYNSAAASPSTPSEPKSKRAEVTDLSAEAFDADKYVKILLNEKNLAGLLKRDNELITEMKQIDGDRKTLVYENYTKLISASDTIRRMREHVEDLEAEMARLSQQVADITSLASDLHGTFTSKKAQVHQLKNAAALLRRLHFLFALPKRLSTALADGSIMRAVQVYATTKPTLARCRDEPLFRGVADECATAVAQIRTAMLTRAKRADLTYPQLLEAIKVLIAIGQDNESVLNLFLDGCSQIVLRSIQESVDWLALVQQVVRSANELCAVQLADKESRDVFTVYLTPELHTEHVERINSFVVKAFTQWETKLASETSDLGMHVDRHQDLRVQIKDYPDIAPTVLDCSRKALGQRIVTNLSHQVTGVDVNVHHSVVNPDPPSSLLQDALKALFRELKEVADKVGAPNLGDEVHSIVPSLFQRLFGTPAANMSDMGLLAQIRLAQNVAEGNLNADLAKYPIAESMDLFLQNIGELCRDAADDLLRLFVFAKGEGLARRAVAQLAAANWMALAHAKCVSRGWMDIMTALAEVAAVVARYFPERDNASTDTASVHSGGQRRGRHLRSSSSMSSQSGGIMGHQYSGSAGSFVAATGGGGSGPGGAGGAVPGSMGPTGGSGTSLRHSPTATLTAAERAQLTSGVHKLFSERPRYYPAVIDGDRTSIIAAMVRIVFKAWVEEARALTLGKNGFQQVLIDVEYCRVRLRTIVRDRHSSDLLDEVVTSCYRRCVEPVFMSRDAISAILGAQEPIADDSEGKMD